MREGNISLVLSVLGEDRSGLVEAIAGAIADHEGNWLDSRMAHLAGHFAGVLRVGVRTDRADGLRAALAALSEKGLRILVAPSGALENGPEPLAFEMKLVADDRPGIIHDISRVLAFHDVNVEELHTEVAGAPMSGERLFRATATLRVPRRGDIDALRGSLEAIANDLAADFFLQDPQPTP